ncbi:MAG: C25 family cysteine peptidase, partial [Candidatus Cloacimonetes bacterium]|nr:C25 family cysteine peptidase [Candidatus Cloacimonadota bacterium]
MKKIVLFMLVSLIASLVFAAEVENFGQSNNSAFTVGARNSRNMSVSFTLPEFTTTQEDAGTSSFSHIIMPNSGSLMERGKPELPTISTTIAVPHRGKVSVEVVSSGQRTISGFMPYPVQQGGDLESPKNFVIDSDYYNNGTNYPEAAIEYSDPMIIRDFRVLQVQINPFSFNAVTGELTIHENIEFLLNFSDESGVNELLTEPTQISASFANIYESMILNFGDYRNAVVANTPPRILMIYGNNTDATYLAALNEFFLWKRQKGADVMVASTASTEAGSSTTSIKNYILAKYNNPATRPDFVVLIGDTQGSYTIPAWNITYPPSTYSGYGDYPYTHLAGSDELGDCFIGRISVENLSQLIVVLTKIYLYERDINIATADWLNRLLLVGDTSPSGISTMYINKYIKETALRVNPNYTATEIYNDNPSASSINTALNQGVGFYSFRGYIDWVPPTESALFNGYKLFHAITITCATGSYAGGTAETEQMLRYGSAAATKGAVTAIGMDTSHTHTTFNNVLHGGIFAGIYVHDMRTMGEAMLHGKLYMNQIFGVSSLYNVKQFSHWCNLMGDPTVEVYTGIPNRFNATMEQSIPLGLSLYDVAVLDSLNNPVEGAAVTLSVGSQIIARSYTGIDGNAILVLPPGLAAGSAILTISKHNFKPLQSTIPIESVPTLVPASIVIDDDNSGASSGNGNGFAGSGESIEVLFGLTNTGTNAINGATGLISTTSPYVTIVNPEISYPNIPGGQVGVNSSPVVIQIAPDAPHETMIRLHLDLTDAAVQQYHVSEFMQVEAARMQFISSLVIDENNQILYPGEAVELSVTVKNSGAVAVTGIQGKLYTLNDLVGVTDFNGFFGDIAADTQVSTGTERFALSARPEVLPGMIIPMSLKLYNETGFEQWVDFSITVGQVSSTNPLGPDAYGYVIYDWTDTGYEQAAIYDWHGISPSEGGLGTPVAISDGYTSNDEGDQVGTDALEVVSLPFPFQFYGVLYDQITICSNGFIAMGVTANAEFRNYRLPGAMGPNPMIAPFWDDLATVAGSGVYTWFDRSNHSFVIEWHNLRNGKNGTSVETFQCILYDQAAYPTSFGDGPIKFQYHTFNNVDSQSGANHGNFSTIGIEDHTGAIGLEYSFNNQYPTAAAQLSSGKAIYITNAPVYHEEAHLIVEATYVNDANGNGVCEPGETVELGVNIRNSGNLTAENVTANISCNSPYITISTNSTVYYPILPGANEVNRFPFRFSIAQDCPAGEVLNFSIEIVSGETTWTRQVSLQVDASNLKMHSYLVDDHDTNFNGVIEAGENVR